MAFDQGLAERIRELLEDERGMVEKPMFGGLAFMVDGKMFCGLVKAELMVRVGAEAHASALAQPDARPMDFTGRPLKGFVYVAEEGLTSDRRLEWWVRQGLDCSRREAASPAPKRRPPARAKASKRIRRRR